MILFYIGISIGVSGTLALLGVHHSRITKLRHELDYLMCHLKHKIGYKPWLTIHEQITEELHLLNHDER